MPTATYTVNTFDVCVPGFERMRSQTEFLLGAYIDADTEAETLLLEWVNELHSCARPDGFDYAAAQEAIAAYWRDTVKPLFAGRRNPFHLEAGRTDIGLGLDDTEAGCTAFLFIGEAAE